ncbi:MAG: IS6 family transposase, partial [Chloroflexi bacterium]|nr:IS6 family transposase [Chloroflexota bacterium]
LWRAVDKHGVVLDILVQQRRDQVAAETFLRRVLAATRSEPRVVITDKLPSYRPALRRVLPNIDHRRHKGLDNRAKNSHQPTRQRERVDASLQIAGARPVFSWTIRRGRRPLPSRTLPRSGSHAAAAACGTTLHLARGRWSPRGLNRRLQHSRPQSATPLPAAPPALT